MTEDSLSQAFEALIQTPAWRRKYPELLAISKELACRQGVPDYVATTTSLSLPAASQQAIAGALSLPACARLLALLKPASARSESYLWKMSGLSDRVVSQSVRRLVESGLVETRLDARLVLSPLVAKLDCELWAFELKLADWQRALYQALQYQAFANRAIVVVPEESSRRFEKNLERFKRFGIGLVIVGTDGSGLREVVSARKKKPASRLHRYVALGHFLGTTT